MAELVWLKRARNDLHQIVSYIEQFDPVAADDIANRIHTLALSLSMFPQRGRPARRGSREMVTVRPYIVRYRIVGDKVVIVGIRHGSRRQLD